MATKDNHKKKPTTKKKNTNNNKKKNNSGVKSTNINNKSKKTTTSKKVSQNKKDKVVETKVEEQVVLEESNGKKEKKSLLKKVSSILPKKSSKPSKTKKTKKSNKKSKSNKKNNSKLEFLTSKKVKRWFIGITIFCVVIILIESIMLVSHYIKKERNTVYYDILNGINLEENGILAVGQSDFRYSSKNAYTKGTTKAKFIKYDNNGKIIFEKMYEKGTNTTFNSVITIEDGYVVVGSGIFSEKEVEEEGREAFIIKYDKKGNIVWEKFYSVITSTTFNKVIEVEDGYIAVGQSIYANMEVGNHTTGGGIIVKYNKDGKEVWHNNHGGTKSGNFNDIVQVGTDFYVVGKDGADSANIVKFDKDGKYLWHKNYRYTDSIGFTGIVYLDNGLYVVGSKKILPAGVTDDDDRTTDNTDCLLVKYDLDGTILFEKTFGGSSHERYNSILSYQNNLYVVGHTTSRDAGLKITTDGKLLTGIIVRYDINGNILKKDVYGGSNNETLTDIATDGVSLYVSGYSNSKNSTIKSGHDNGKDYFGKVIKSNFKFKTLMVK